MLFKNIHKKLTVRNSTIALTWSGIKKVDMQFIAMPEITVPTSTPTEISNTTTMTTTVAPEVTGITTEVIVE